MGFAWIILGGPWGFYSWHPLLLNIIPSLIFSLALFLIFLSRIAISKHLLIFVIIAVVVHLLISLDQIFFVTCLFLPWSLFRMYHNIAHNLALQPSGPRAAPEVK